MEQITEHFNREEFACKGVGCCSNSAPICLELVEKLEYLRGILNRPIKILSGFRCITHNRAISSKDTSQHTRGLAADLSVQGLSPEALYTIADGCGLFTGVGLYAWGVHADIRPGGPARWDLSEMH